MNAEMLIKARKVFVEDNIVENSEDCPHCLSKGLQKKLRYFYLSLEEKIYKCENANCLYPFQRFIFKSLVDNSVYYYEEVVDEGGRELFFRVPMDRQNDFQSSNPLSSQLFCDNQRNPSIEDYSFDFSDLFNDIDTDVMEPTPSKLPSSTENPDALEFLDEINIINTSHGQNENEIGIDDIFNESPVKRSPNKPMSPQPSTSRSQFTTQNANSGTSKEKPKLLKCIKHLDKVKKAQSRKTSEKSKQPFTTAILNARKKQTKVQNDSAATNEDGSESQQTSKQKPNTISKRSSTAGFLKSANNLRPIELARTLSTLKSLNTSSQFLQQYMKVKEEKLFADELEPEQTNQMKSGSEKTVTTSKPNNDLENPNQKPIADSMGPPISNTVLKNPNTTKRPAPRNSVKNEASPAAVPTQKDGEIKKKERKPRTKKQNNVENVGVDIGIKKEQHDVETEPANGATVIATKKVVTAKRKPVNANYSTESCSTSTETMDQNNEVVVKTEPKKYSRKRKSVSVDGGETISIEKGAKEATVPAKRQRKPKENKNDKSNNEETKPKRSRATKTKNNPIKLEQPSLPVVDSDANDCQVIYLSVPESENSAQPGMITFALEKEQTQPNECGLEIIVEKDRFEIASTSQQNPTMLTIDGHSMANVLVAADLVHKNESNFTAESVQNEHAYANTADQHKSELVSSTKRQCKSIYSRSNTSGQTQNVEVKPKRVRIPKAKVNSIEIKEPSSSSPGLLNEDMIDTQTSVCATNIASSEPVLPSSSQQKVSVQKTKRKPTDTTAKQMNKEKIGRGASKQLIENALVIPSTSQMDPTIAITFDDSSAANELVAADAVHTYELNLNHITETAHCEITVTEDPNENSDKGKTDSVGPAKRQRRSKYSRNVEVGQNESVETKPKRGRASKSKPVSIKIEQPSLQQLPLNDEVTDSHTKSSITDELNANTGNGLNSFNANETMQHQHIDSDSSNKCIDVCDSTNDSSISIISSTEKLESHEGINTEPKKNVRKRKTTSVAAYEPKSTEKKNIEKDGPSKRQRKSKGDNDTKADIKPKRSRTSKSKAIPIETKLPPLSLLSDDDDDVTDCKEKSNANETNVCLERMTMEKIDFDSSQRQMECALESNVKEDICEKPSTSQMNPMVNTIVDRSAAEDLIAILADDSVHSDELSSYRTTKPGEQECASKEGNSNVHINPVENSNEQQFCSTYGQHGGQLIQPKLEPMDYESDSDNDQSKKQKSSEASDSYYRRKVFKKEKVESFHVDNLLNEWDDDFEQQKGRTHKDSPSSNHPNDVDDTISITSTTSDSSCGFVGEPYYEKPTTSSSNHQ